MKNFFYSLFFLFVIEKCKHAGAVFYLGIVTHPYQKILETNLKYALCTKKHRKKVNFQELQELK